MGAIAIPKGQNYQKFKKDFSVGIGFPLLPFVLLIHFPSTWWGRVGAGSVGCAEGFYLCLAAQFLRWGVPVIAEEDVGYGEWPIFCL
jgi:hypothetical protein